MLCKCGCGIETGLAKHTDERYGVIEGQPLNYLPGHQNVLRKLPEEEYKKRRREGRNRWASRHPERIRKGRLKLAGWTLETFASAKHEQGNRCAICLNIPEIKQRRSEALVPDHKHGKPPEPRALLCPDCNAGLGMFKERPEVLEAAAAYLRKFSQPIGADLSKPSQSIEENL